MMVNHIELAHDDGMVPATLEGGPAGFPDQLRVMSVEPTTQIVKVEYCGGHEHFARADDSDDVEPSESVLFRWATRTKIAE
jgi:hypothetical protein